LLHRPHQIGYVLLPAHQIGVARMLVVGPDCFHKRHGGQIVGAEGAHEVLFIL
jgi:hypothetical protein